MTLLEVVSGVAISGLLLFGVLIVGPGLVSLVRGAGVDKALKESRQARADLLAAITGLATTIVLDVGGLFGGVADFVAGSPFGVLASVGPLLGGLAIWDVVPITGGEFIGVGLLVVGLVLVLSEVR